MLLHDGGARAASDIGRLSSDQLTEARREFEPLLAEAEARGEESSIRALVAHLAHLETRTGRWLAAEALARRHLATAEDVERRGAGALAWRASVPSVDGKHQQGKDCPRRRAWQAPRIGSAEEHLPTGASGFSSSHVGTRASLSYSCG